MHQEHAATMRMQLEETLGTFSGYFFVTLFLNEAVQRVTFGYVTRSTSFNDVRFRLHILARRGVKLFQLPQLPYATNSLL